jgi:hypothetical protein
MKIFIYQIKKINKLLKKLLTSIQKLFQKISASTLIYSEARFLFFFLAGIMIAYVMSFPLGLLASFQSLIPIIWNAAWRLWLIRCCFILAAIILESWFYSNRNDKDS